MAKGDIVLHVQPALAVVDPRDDRAARAVAAYVGGQLSIRSQQNARDALRRIARMMLVDPTAQAEEFPWPAISYEIAMAIRGRLFDLTVEEAITPGTANLTLSHLRGIIRTMYAMKLVTHEQLAAAHPGMLKNVAGSRKTRGRALNEKEERALRAAAREFGGYAGTMLDTAIVTAIGGGLRREEITRLAVDNLKKLDAFSIVGKGNKEREVVIDEAMKEVIEPWMRLRRSLAPEHQMMFCAPSNADQQLSTWSFWSLVRQAAHDAFGDREECESGCECEKTVTGPHDFRRTFATRLFNQGWDIRQIQVLMGHNSPDTTALYDKRDEKAIFDKRREAKVIA